MKYSSIEPQLFIQNRKRFAKSLKPNALSVFVSNDIMPTNGDGIMGFVQNSDLFYLSGVDQEDCILLILSDLDGGVAEEILFVKETNALIAVWEGAKLSKLEATNVSGVDKVCWLEEFQRQFDRLAALAEYLYINDNEHPRACSPVQTAQKRFNNRIKHRFPLHKVERSAPILQLLRTQKSTIEIDLIRQACSITEKGFRRILPVVKPGIHEYEIEAELSHEFIRNRSRGFAYSPIIASGESACVLHYTDNNKVCKDGDIILLDVAAEYANYASDLTRSIPVNGRFTTRQREVYDAVLRVMKKATAMLTAGTLIPEYHKAVGELMEEELFGLKLLSLADIKAQTVTSPAYKKYFMHGTSHFLGIDVHDVGDYTQVIPEGAILTCEPGIYIPEENLGIRLENDILVTNGGPVDLMASIPLEAEEIEDLMNTNV